MEYRVIEAGAFSTLVDVVNKAIKEGWKPQGGVAVKRWKTPTTQEGHNYIQVMIKEAQ